MNDSSSPILRVVIVDDEPLAREGLRQAVTALSMRNLIVTAVCENGVEALEVIRRDRPDILLLDIAMPVLDGFAMLERLEPEATPPAVIFVTAYDEHAVRAFEAEATDFLVKPVSRERLLQSIDRASRRIAESRALRAELEPAELALDPVPRYLEQVVIPERGRQIVLPVEDIEWIEGDTYYVRIHSHGRSRLLRERLSRLEAALDPARFRRTHRSALVRLDLIREIRNESPYSWSALLSSGQRVPVSRERLKDLELALKAQLRAVER